MKYIPNVLSIFRIALIPFFIWQMILGNTVAAGCILLTSSVTDFFDGLIARKFNWTSELGKLLDPIADKLTQTAVSIILILKLHEYWYFFAFMILKDFIILLLGAILLRQGMKFKGSSFIGKVSTFFFYGGMLLIVFFPNLPAQLVFAIVLIAVSLALISGLMYIPSYKEYKQEISSSEESNELQ